MYCSHCLCPNSTAFRRFTKRFAQLAKSVVAVDFMESFLEKNREENGHFGTVEFLHKDATQLAFEPNRYFFSILN